MNFPDLFKQLTGNTPFPWQESLYEQFISDAPDNIPQSCKLPTGLGKTSVVAVWLLALAAQPQRIPRRLVYVVNRRTVVDQTTLEVEKYRHALVEKPELIEIQKCLASLFVTSHTADKKQVSPLAVSTLRGQFADNREWSFNPSRPAVICGTVDMIGSRLLFNGYGIGFKSKPLHAGFLGQDVLIVHDEAHLEPAFQQLLESIVSEQGRCHDISQFHVMALTATPRGRGKVFELTPKDHADAKVTERINACKKLVLHTIEDEKKQLSNRIIELCEPHQQSGSAILVFVRTIETLNAVVAALQKSKCIVQQLSGTIRGLERDRMADPRNPGSCPVFARFLPRPNESTSPSDAWKIEPAKGTVFLVCTSAGEIGVNLSADHLVCDLTPFDSMAQRFGRVNRFGLLQDTRIDIVLPTQFDSHEYDISRSRTIALLRQLNGSGCPQSIGKLDSSACTEAYTPEPVILDATDFLFDSWSLTTIQDKLPGRPLVAPYLHGVSEWEPEQTKLAWREEVELLERRFSTAAEKLQFQKQAAEMLSNYPLKSHELLSDRSDRIFNSLKKLDVDGSLSFWLTDDESRVEVISFRDIISQDKKYLEGKTLLLPPKAGGLEKGSFNASAKFDAAKDDYDVADERIGIDERRLRMRVWDNETPPPGMALIDKLDTLPPDQENEDESEKRYRCRFVLRPEGSRNSNHEVYLADHVEDVVQFASSIVDRLFIQTPLKNAVILAAKFHDLGKRRASFQRVLGNFDPSKPPLAKSGPGNLRNRLKEEYRHEFGSLNDVQSEPEFKKLSEDDRDLVLHLIAVHHGFGRPHFPNPYDPEKNEVERLASEVPKRFARLQQKYGRWGLAYVESLLRAADWAASADPTVRAEVQR